MTRFIWMLLMLPISLHIHAAATVELRQQAQQSFASLSLGDIAVITGDDRSQLDLLKAMLLPGKGRAGDTVVYSRAEIAQSIFFRHPAWIKTVKVNGAERVLVGRDSQQLAAEKYIDWARQALLQQLPAEERVIVKSSGIYRDLIIPPGVASAKVRLERDVMRRNARVVVDIDVDDVFYTSVPVNFSVQRFGQALVLMQSGSARQHLRAEMVTVRETDISMLAGDKLVDPNSLNGKRLRHDLTAGTPLSSSDIEDCPPIERGDEIKVFATVGRVLVQTQAVAEGDGFIGQRVSVRTAKTQEQLMVDVIGDERAIVSNNQVR